MSEKKPWRVSSPADNYEEDFATEAESLADAEKVLDLFREEARDEGEWDEDVEFVQVYRLCHTAQVIKREKDDDGYEHIDYGMMPVAEA